MKSFGVAVVIAGLISALLAVLGFRFVGMIVYMIPVFAAVGAAAALNRSTWASALIAAGIGFAICLAVGGVAAIFVKGSGPSCDGFCMTQAGARVFVLFLAALIGLVVALISAFFALIVCRSNGRSVA